ncbi:MAG: class F sortase [Pseudonocardiaceae bacterium]
MRHRLTCATTVCSLVAVLFLGACATADDADTSTAPTAEPSAAAHPRLSSYRSTRTHTETAPPVRLRIPVIDVDTGLEALGRASDQSIEVPRQPSSAGWWAGGPRPGQVGPAVILGHVDSQAGPAVFFRLGELEAGDEVLVDRADGTTARFQVASLDHYQKAEFPSELVYYPTVEPELRLVTCGGPFDPSTGHYRDNVVVFAAQAR